MNTRTGASIANQLEPAFDSNTRNRGLLGRDHLAQGAALILAPCSSIHTFFMRFPIDVVFVSRVGRVLKIYAALPAWRIGFAVRAFAAVEVPGGTAAAAGLQRGDTIKVVSERDL